MNFFKLHPKYIFAGVSAIILIAVGIFFFKSGTSKAKDKFNPAFLSYISGYTSGQVSREAAIQVQFVADIIPQEKIGQNEERELFNFSPSIKGNAVWVSRNILEFRPEEVLPSGKLFNAKLYLEKLLEVPSGLEVFEFSFQTLKQSFTANIYGISYPDIKKYEDVVLKGSFTTVDVAEIKLVEKVLKASQDGKELAISWKHTDPYNHDFEITGVKRKEAATKVQLAFEGSPIEAEKKETIMYDIPAIGDFQLISTKVVQEAEQYIEIQFSSPLLVDQNLNGLLFLQNVQDCRIVLDANVVKLYPPERQIGTKTLVVSEGIKNSLNKRFAKTQTFQLSFEELKPAIRAIGKGIIMPSSNGKQFPFEAVNVKAVEITVSKIFEKNIAQFFQVNNYDEKYGPREINRVGKIIVKKLIPLVNSNRAEYAFWKKYAIDLSELIKAEPGAIYQVKLRFKKEHALYACDGETIDATPVLSEAASTEELDDLNNENNYYDDGYYYYDEDGGYDDGKNPCKNYYYSSNNAIIKRMILASDMGVMAKRGNDGEMMVLVTDLKSAEPVAGATVEVFDYQQQTIKTGQTDGDGILKLDIRNKPYFIIVKKVDQRGYLRTDDATALQTTFFDVSGDIIEKGIKGFIYGERGVWRPGDSLFVSFMLEDKQDKIPDNHPVVFELFNPSGQLSKQLVSTSALNGLYTFKFNTDPDALTGSWLAVVKVGGTKFTKELKIETVMPNRLKINVDFGREKLTATDNSLNAMLSVKWLHGAIARNLNTEVSMILNKADTKFEKYLDYNFEDLTKSFSSEYEEIFKGKINAEGEAKISATVHADNAPGLLNVNFKVKVYEESGAASVDNMTIPYYPFSTYVGMKAPPVDPMRKILFTGQDNKIEIVTLNEKGIPISSKVEVEIYKMEWRWWYDQTEGSNWMDFNYNKPIKYKEITTGSNGKGTYNLKIESQDWGRYLVRMIDTKSRHTVTQVLFIDWLGYGESSQERSNSGANVLFFNTDKEKYEVGEKGKLLIPSGGEGRAFISFETGSGVLKTFWKEVKKGITEFEFEITEDMAPNTYANVTLLQPHAQTINDLPIRLYGIVPIKVENKKNILNPIVNLPLELRPEASVSISVKEQDGKPMTYTLAMVDEGLLDLTRFKTPAPYNKFYAREALGIHTWDMYDYVMGAFVGTFERLLSIGGDMNLKGHEKNKFNRFKPAVKFLGPFELNKGDENTHTFKMPNYIGSVRVMVVAGHKGAYGAAEKTAAVKKPLMVIATLPRVLGPDEEVVLPVDIFNMDKKNKNVTVDVSTNGLLELLEVKRKSIEVNAESDNLVYFKAKVKSTTGIAKVKIIATSGGEKSVFDIELEVRNPNPTITKIIDKTMTAGETWAASYELFGLPGTNKGVLEVANIPPMNLESRLDYLIRYPYGCAEQTTSSVFPQLAVKNLVQSSQEELQLMDRNIKAGIQRLKTFQTPEGAIAYWPGEYSYISEWCTNYAGHFMIEAEKKGYELPIGFLAQWKKYQRKTAQEWTAANNSSNDVVQAYRLYTLALAGIPELGAMNRLKEMAGTTLTAKWILAGAYILAGQSTVATAIVNNLGTNVVYKSGYYSDIHFGSQIRDKAMILEVMAQLGNLEKALPIARELAANLSSNVYMNTQETAFALIALAKLSEKGGKRENLNFDYAFNNSKRANANSELPVYQVKIGDDDLKKAKGEVMVKNNAKSIQYARLILSGIPAAGNEPAVSNNISLSVQYTDMNGNVLNPTAIEQGTTFTASISVKNPGVLGDYSNIALRQIFPSGWEITNSRMENQEATPTADANVKPINYQDIRDDRVYTFFKLKPNEMRFFNITLTASYLGRFYLPSQIVEDMYMGNVNAATQGQWIEVVKQKDEAVSKAE